MAISIWPYNVIMKTTVELPDDVLRNARLYAAERGKTFKSVLIEALDLLMFNGQPQANRPGWEALAGAFADSEETAEIQAYIDREFSRIDPEDWK